MTKCCVVGCHSDSDKDTSLSFYRFPHDQVLCTKWALATKWSKDVLLETARVCSIHFDEIFFEDLPSTNPFIDPVKKLKVDAVPTLYLPSKFDEKISSNSQSSSKLQFSLYEERTNKAEDILNSIQTRILDLEKDQHFLKETVLSLEKLNDKTSFDIRVLKSKLGV